jgi:hypothetical protein
MVNKSNWWKIELENKPDFEIAMERIYAWYENEIIDRAPIRFSSHNEQNEKVSIDVRGHNTMKDRWFDSEYQIEKYLRSISGTKFLAETIPVFFPNLGPEVYSAFYGGTLEYQEVTAYYKPYIRDWDELGNIQLDITNEYWQKLDELTDLAIEMCRGRSLVGYTDLHPGLDCAAAWRDPEQFCLDLLINPEEAKELITLSTKDFHKIFDYWDKKLKDNGMLSVTWIGLPSFAKFHIPGADFSSMISPEMFTEFGIPILANEVKGIDHVVFHLDGKGVAKHIDQILTVPEIQAIQWVQGVGDDAPIMQWVPFIKKLQKAGKGVMVDLKPKELEPFMNVVNPKGIFLCISASEDIQPEIIKRVECWK